MDSLSNVHCPSYLFSQMLVGGLHTLAINLRMHGFQSNYVQPMVLVLDGNSVIGEEKNVLFDLLKSFD